MKAKHTNSKFTMFKFTLVYFLGSLFFKRKQFSFKRAEKCRYSHYTLGRILLQGFISLLVIYFAYDLVLSN